MNIKLTEQAQKQNLGIEAAPFLHARLSTRAIMLITSGALLPGFLCLAWFQGFGLVWQFLICLVTSLVCEGAVALLRHRNLGRVLTDGSFLVTCMLLAMTLPPLLPWYLTAVTAAFAILLVKEAFGGLGMNIFNPAMAGFIFVFISCSGFMFSTWLSHAPGALTAATPQATYEVIFKGADPLLLRAQVRALDPQLKDYDAQRSGTDARSGATAASEADAVSGATWLENVKAARKQGDGALGRLPEVTDAAVTAYASTALALAAGGIALMCLHIIIIRMVLAYFAALLIFAALGHYLWPDLIMAPLPQLLLGGAVLAGFFIITDPVTNAGTSKGRIAFAVFAAFLIVVIRACGSYSDSVAFSVLLANAAAPLIDVLTRRRAFGHGYRGGELD